MSKITHNNIIMWLEDVVPQMQKSSSAEDCLLKYAKEHNMSPAILERVAHMFNSLKTNSAYNLAKTASERGNFITTLDVPALLEKYASLAEGIDYDNLITNISKVNGLHFQANVIVKSASSKDKVGNIEDLKLLSNLELNQPKVYNAIKTAGVKKDETTKVASAKEEKPYELIIKANKMVEEAHDLHAKSLNLKTAAVKGLINKFARDEFKSFSKFAKDMAVYIGDDEYTKVVFEKIASDIGKTNKKYASYLKENLGDIKSHRAIIRESDIDMEAAGFVGNYVEGMKLAGEADEALNKSEELLKKNASITKEAMNLKDVRQAAEVNKRVNNLLKGLTPDQKKNIDLQNLINEVTDEFVKEQKDNIKEQKENEQLQSEKDDFEREKQRLAIDTLRQNAQKQKQESKNKQADKLYGLAGKGFKSGWGSIASGAEHILKERQDLLNSIEEADYKESKIVDPIKKVMNDIQAKANLQQLLYMDPVLSRLNDDELENLMEVYNSIVLRNPTVASDKGLLRSVLRQAVNVKGIDLSTAESLGKVSNPKLI